MGACVGVGMSVEPGGVAAATQAVSAALERAAGAVDTVLLFASVQHADPRPLVSAAQGAARGARVVGCSVSGVLGEQRELEDGAAVVAMALGGFDVRRFHGADAPSDGSDDDGDDGDDGDALSCGGKGGLALLFADGYSEDPDALAARVAARLPGCAVAGAISTGPSGVFPAYRWHDGEIGVNGVSGMILCGEAPIVEVTQGCRPIGAELVVTRASGKVVAELDGRPAFAAFAERARPLLDDLRRAAQTVFVAVPCAGDGEGEGEGGDAFVVRGILQFDPERGLLALSEPVAEGTRLRFALRDAVGARADLQRMLERVKRRLDGRPPRLGLYFNCAGRGRALFGVPDHDIAHIHGTLGAFPLAGVFGGGEIGPGGGRSRLHLFSGVLAVLP